MIGFNTGSMVRAFWSGAFVVAASTLGATNARAALIEYLPFNGSADAAVGTNGALVATTGVLPTFTADRYGNANSAVQFSGSTDDQQRVTIAGSGGLNNLQAGTIAFAVKWNGIQSPGFNDGTYGSVLSRQSDEQFSEFGLLLNGADPATARIEFRLGTATGTSLVSTVAPGDGVWHQLAITFDTTTHVQQLFIDGVLDATGNDSGIIHDNSTVPLTIGAWGTQGHTWSSSTISDFRVYDNTLSAAAIQAVPEPTSASFTALVTAAGLLKRRSSRRTAMSGSSR